MLDKLVYEIRGVGLPNMVLGCRSEGRRLDRCGASVNGGSVNPEPDGEVLRDRCPRRCGFGCVPRWGGGEVERKGIAIVFPEPYLIAEERI